VPGIRSNPLTVYVAHDEAGVAPLVSVLFKIWVAFVWFPNGSSTSATTLVILLAAHTSWVQPAAIVSLLIQVSAGQLATKLIDANDAAIKKPRKVVLNDILFPISNILFKYDM
jgi:hypothetical protein